MTRQSSTRDPSLRLKSGYAQDDAKSRSKLQRLQCMAEVAFAESSLTPSRGGSGASSCRVIVSYKRDDKEEGCAARAVAMKIRVQTAFAGCAVRRCCKRPL